MMGDLPDPEKPPVAAPSAPSLPSPDHEQEARQTSHASTATNPSLDKEPSIHPIRLRTTSSSDSINSIDSDPLEPLERALTPDQQTPAEHLARPFRSYTTTSIATNGSRLPNFEVDFEPNDPRNPRNWPAWYRGIVLAGVSFSTWVTVLYSTSYTSGLPMMMEEFGETNTTLSTLGVTTYLFGLAIGSVVLAPLSEIWGRRPIYMCTMGIFTLLVLPCAMGTSMWEIILVRFFGFVSLPPPPSPSSSYPVNSLPPRKETEKHRPSIPTNTPQRPRRLRHDRQRPGHRDGHLARRNARLGLQHLVDRPHERAHHRPANRRLRSAIPRLALDELDRDDPRWRSLDLHLGDR